MRLNDELQCWEDTSILQKKMRAANQSDRLSVVLFGGGCSLRSISSFQSEHLRGLNSTFCSPSLWSNRLGVSEMQPEVKEHGKLAPTVEETLKVAPWVRKSVICRSRSIPSSQPILTVA